MVVGGFVTVAYEMLGMTFVVVCDSGVACVVGGRVCAILREEISFSFVAEYAGYLR